MSVGSAYLSIACPERSPSCPHMATTSAKSDVAVAVIEERDDYLARPDLDAPGAADHRRRKQRTRRRPSGQAHGIHIIL